MGMGDFYFKPQKRTSKTEAGKKPQTALEGTPETQMASISDDLKRSIEPWSGKWTVEGMRHAQGKWVLKQSEDTVVSTKDSLYEIEGSVVGNTFKGKLKGGGYVYFFKLQISSDGQSFNGSIIGQSIFISGLLKGTRQE
jgi:hypothetical protein